MRKLNRVFALAVLVSLCVANFHAQMGGAAQAGSYGKITREAIDHIIAANNEVLSGDPAEAKRQLLVIKSSLQTLENLVQQFRDVSVREFDRCKDRQSELNIKIGNLDRQEEELTQRIGNLNAELAAASTRKTLTESEIRKLQQSMAGAQASIQETQAKLRELEKWWWVPGYGAYLGVRTLVDQDIQRYNQSASTLRDEQSKLQANVASLGNAQAALRALEADKKSTQELIGKLVQLRDTDQARLKQLNQVMIFLTTATTFWGKAQITAEVNGQSFVGTMQILQELLGTNFETPSFKDPTALAEVNSFGHKMVGLADSIDQNTNFLLSPTTDYCGGPPRSTVAITKPCEITEITEYYEIVDAKTCAFRYLTPPGCPGESRKPAADAAAVASRRQAYAWVRAQDQNWLGRARCKSAAVIYYGKMSNADECEQRCRGDAECTSWTFNHNNGYMPDSLYECWGGLSSADLDKSSWGGFTSGGVR